MKKQSTRNRKVFYKIRRTPGDYLDVRIKADIQEKLEAKYDINNLWAKQELKSGKIILTLKEGKEG